MQSNIDQELLAQQVGYRSFKRYASRCLFLFSDLSLKGKRLLEVGCGSGAFCIWCALKGADNVLGIEPEAEGSTQGSSHKFLDAISEYDLKNIEFKPCFLQELPVPEKKFDILLMYNVINHLDEDAVQVIHNDKQAYDNYVQLVSSLKQYLNKDAVVIIADCGRSNFWNSIGRKSPFSRTIDWSKHQNPKLWTQLFKDAGFTPKDCRWSPMYPLGNLSQNRLIHFLTISHFVMRFELL